MKNKTLIMWSMIFALAISINAQDSSKILIADGTKQISGTPIYSTEAETVLEKTKIGTITLPVMPPTGLECGENDYFRVLDSEVGFFTTEKFKSKAYLYSDCNPKNKHKYQGIIVLHDNDILAHYVINHFSEFVKGDEKISVISDLNGDSLDELAIFTAYVTLINHQKKGVGIVELLPDNINALDGFQLNYDTNIDDKIILLASKIYAEKKADNSLIFYEEQFRKDGKTWRKIRDLQKPEPFGGVEYIKISRSFGIIDIAFGTLVLQSILFVLLFPLTIYAMFKGITTPAKANEKPVENETSTPEPDFPKLKPLNCPNCGAGVPLRDENMSCPGCQTSFPVPKEYEEIRIFRNDIAKNLKSATNYWTRAKFLTSSWIRWGIFLLAIWLIASPVIIGFAEIRGNKPAYVHLFGAKFFGLAVLAWLFWIFTLFLMSGMILPRTRKILPTLETTENLGSAETANCSQCGGAIQYAKSDIAAICGYCGIETYRAKIAWKVRNAVNDVRQKASFSLIEAMSAFREAVDDIIYTPIILMFILVVLPALLFGVFYVLDLIGVTDLIDFLDNLF